MVLKIAEVSITLSSPSLQSVLNLNLGRTSNGFASLDDRPKNFEGRSLIVRVSGPLALITLLFHR